MVHTLQTLIPYGSLTLQDILSLEEYTKERSFWRDYMIQYKKDRRLFVGPHAHIIFENRRTFLYQIQEMLTIEKGGQAQVVDELAAYGAMVPKGDTLVATVMLEVENSKTLQRLLRELKGIETKMFLKVGDQSIQGQSLHSLEQEDKTSVIHFLEFLFTRHQKEILKDLHALAFFEIGHSYYIHRADIPRNVRESIANDLA